MVCSGFWCPNLWPPNALKRRTDIVIKKANKDDTIVVETTDKYIEDGLKHLDNPDIYQPLTEDLNQTISTNSYQ